MLYTARAALLGLVAIWAAANRRPILLVVLCLASILPNLRPDLVARPALVYLAAALILFLRDPGFATGRGRLMPLATWAAGLVGRLFGERPAVAKQPARGWRFWVRVALGIGGIAVASLTIPYWVLRMGHRLWAGSGPFEAPQWLYLMTLLWAVLALVYAVKPWRRLHLWLLLLFLTCLLAWTYTLGRQRQYEQERELRRTDFAKRDAKASAARSALESLETRAQQAGRTSFAELDGDADGSLTLEEFASRPQPLLFDLAGRDFASIEPAIAAYHFKNCDVDQDGRVSEAEWTCTVDIAARRGSLTGLLEHREWSFPILDENSNDRIALDELLAAPRACRPYTDEKARSLFARRDADGDGLLTRREWVRR